jgi:hypothetical protein
VFIGGGLKVVKRNMVRKKKGEAVYLIVRRDFIELGGQTFWIARQ